MEFGAHSYDGVAYCYDELASLYSLGRIEMSKQSQIGSLSPTERVLFAGVGRGRDAIAAARCGVAVTAIDLSPIMLGRFSRGLEREALRAEAIEGDVASHHPELLYDTVVAHYFLNLFEIDRAAAMLSILCRLVRPGGRLIFADFAPGEGGTAARWITEAYFRPVNWVAWAFGFCALHPIPDYPDLIERAGARIRTVSRFPVIPGLANPAYQSVVAERIG
ncbi:MAG: class I SAM-dependent methyltransferase [bacterium]|nr:class I SAM-dependent methyltransferase [bacterium]